MTASENADSKRGEDKTIEEVQREGGVFNINDSKAAYELPNGTLRLLVWPGMGARMLSTHSARLKPGQAFEPRQQRAEAIDAVVGDIRREQREGEPALGGRRVRPLQQLD